MSPNLYFVKFESMHADAVSDTHTGLCDEWLPMDSVSGCNIVKDVSLRDRDATIPPKLNPVRIGALLMSTRQRSLTNCLRALRSIDTEIERVIVQRMSQNGVNMMLEEETIIEKPRLSFLLNDDESTVIEFRDFAKYRTCRYTAEEDGTVTKSQMGYSLAEPQAVPG